jgi:hypothetical protein
VEAVKDTALVFSRDKAGFRLKAGDGSTRRSVLPHWYFGNYFSLGMEL